MSGLAGWRRRRVLVVLGCVGVAVAALLGVLLHSDGGSASAHSLGRGAPVTLTPKPGVPAVLDHAASVASVNHLRREVHLAAVSESVCLDAAAKRAVAVFDRGGVSSAPTGCGSVRWGWVAGVDPSGAQMLRAADVHTTSGATSLVAASMRRIGFAVGPRRMSGVLTGYVLVWVVSA